MEFNLFDFDLNVTRTSTYRVDDAFEARVGREIPARFSFVVPIDDDNFRVIENVQPGGGIVKIFFATHNDVLIENINFVEATIPMGPLDQRLSTFDQLLRTQAFPMSVANYQNPVLTGTRPIEIGGLQGVELVGTYVDPTIGLLYLRMIGIPHPNRAESLFVVMNINAALVPLEGPDQLSQTLTGRTVATFQFLD